MQGMPGFNARDRNLFYKMSKRGRKNSGDFCAFKQKSPRKEWGRKNQWSVVQKWIIKPCNGSLRMLKSAIKSMRGLELAIVPLDCEPTIANIKAACERFFKAEDMECDILAGERGPSWTKTS